MIRHLTIVAHLVLACVLGQVVFMFYQVIVENDTNIYDIAMHMMVVVVVALFFYSLIVARIHDLINQGRMEKTLEQMLYKNTLTQPSELDTLGHKTNRVFRRK